MPLPASFVLVTYFSVFVFTLLKVVYVTYMHLAQHCMYV